MPPQMYFMTSLNHFISPQTNNKLPQKYFMTPLTNNKTPQKYFI